MVNTRDVVWNTSTPRDRYFKWAEAMAPGHYCTTSSRPTLLEGGLTAKRQKAIERVLFKQNHTLIALLKGNVLCYH